MARRLPILDGVARGAYAVAANVLLPLGLPLALPVLLLRPKRRRTLLPRLGVQRYPEFPPGHPAPVWVHALSVGELLSAVPLIEGLRGGLGKRPLVLSVSTHAAQGLAVGRLGRVVDGLFYFPIDSALAYRRCLARIRPALFVLVETDVWPGYLAALRRRGVPCVLVNGRVSARSYRALDRWWGVFGPAFAAFERIHAQSDAEAARYRALGVAPARLGFTGNLKYDACGAVPTPDAIAALAAELGYAGVSRVLLAGSTHRGEEAIVRQVYLELRRMFADLKLLLVPRHPDRGEEVGRLFAADGLSVRRLSAPAGPAPEVLIVDRLGYLNRLYRLATVAFVGGSLVPKGGQNPIEPAMAGKPILFGPDMQDFPEISVELVEAGGAARVHDAAEFAARATELLRDPARAEAAGARARAIVAAHAGITARLVASLLERVRV